MLYQPISDHMRLYTWNKNENLPRVLHLGLFQKYM